MTGSWIEFFGPPGVGKTTIYQSLSGRGVKGPSQIPSISGAADRLVAQPQWGAFHDHVIDAFSRCARGLAESRIRTYRSRMERTGQLMEAGGLWVVDDWLCQRGQSLAASQPAQWADIERFYELIPLPAGIVVLTAEANEIRRRNFHRGRDGKPDLSGEVDQALHVVETAMAILERRGAKLLTVDAMGPKPGSVRLVNAFVREIHTAYQAPK